MKAFKTLALSLIFSCALGIFAFADVSMAGMIAPFLIIIVLVAAIAIGAIALVIKLVKEISVRRKKEDKHENN